MSEKKGRLGKTVRKVLAGIGVVVGGLLLVVAGFLWWALSTRAGARRVIAFVGSSMKGSLQVASVEGPIRGPLVLHGITYETPSMTVAVERARLEWRLWELLAKRLDIVSLRASGVRIHTTPAPEKKKREALPDFHLPINVVVRQAAVTDIETISKGGEPFRIDSIELATRVVGDEVRVERLAVRGPTFTADISGTLEPQGAYPLDLATSWSWTSESRADGKSTPKRYAGRGRLSGTVEKLHVVQELASPSGVGLDATLFTPMRDLRFSGDVAVRDFDPRTLAASAPAAVVTGVVHAEGALARFASRGALRVRTDVADLGQVQASFALRREEDLYRLDRVDLLLSEGSSAHAAGTVRLSGKSPAFDLKATWSRLEWPLRGPAAVASSKGELAVAGTLDAYTLSATAQVRAKDMPPGSWTLSARGNSDRLTLEALRGEILGGAFSARGTVGWKPNLSWDLAVAGENLDPAGIVTGYPGRVAFEGATRGTLGKSGADGSVTLTKLDGSLRGAPVSGRAEARFAGSAIDVRRADFRIASARVRGSGRIGDKWDFSWSVAAPNLAVFLPDAAGSLDANGTLTGPRATPRARLTAEGRSIRVGAREIARLHLDADVSLARDAASRVLLDAGGVVVVAGKTLDTVAVRLTGSLGRHDLTVTATTPRTEMALAASGGVPRAPASRPASSGTAAAPPLAWEGRLTSLAVTSPDLTGRLAHPADLSLAANQARIRDFSWSLDRGRLDLDGEWRKAGPSRMQATIAGVPLAILAPWLPAGVHVTGPVDGRVEAATAASGSVVASVTLRPGPGEIRYTGAAGQTVAFRYSDTLLELTAKPEGAAARFSLTVADAGTLGGRLALPDYNAKGVPEPSQRISGRVMASFSDIAFARAFVASVGDLHGAFHADVSFDGTVRDPMIRGEASLTGARAAVPVLGIELSDVAFTARGDGGPLFRLEGRAESGDGTLQLAGQTPLVPSKQNPAKIRITGRRFQAMGTAERKVWISPDLTAVADGRRISVTGAVRVPETRIEYVKKFATVPLSPDVVFVGASTEDVAAARSKRGQVIAARVRIVLGDRVDIQAMGFDGRVTGSLLVIDEPGQPTSATGELEIVSGTYKAYGQDLTIEHGRIVFAGGPVTNPYVDLRAYRKVDDGTIAGVVVQGTVRNPSVSLYSQPAMSQADALAYLILGHPLGQATPQEGNLVANAATSLGIKGGNLLGKKIAARFGLETARIEAKSGLESASLVVGKYLSPKLYVQYGIGIFDPVSTLRLRYILSRKWSISAETSGDANGGDLLYTVDAGRVPPAPPPVNAERRID